MVSIEARDCFRSGFKERLRRMDSERIWMKGEDDFERPRRVDIAPSVCASKLLYWGLTLVMEAKVWRAFC